MHRVEVEFVPEVVLAPRAVLDMAIRVGECKPLEEVVGWGNYQKYVQYPQADIRVTVLQRDFLISNPILCNPT